MPVAAIKKSDDAVKISPGAEDSISEGDRLVVVGPSDGIHNIKEKFKQ